VRALFWTKRARGDLASIRVFIEQDSPYFADVVIGRLFIATDRLAEFPESGREVPEFPDSGLREIVHHPYRIVYRLVGNDAVHILTVHHGARRLPASL
jgi:plasmid stabilization system protein ParE